MHTLLIIISALLKWIYKKKKNLDIHLKKIDLSLETTNLK